MTRKQKKNLCRIIAAALLLIAAFVTDLLVGERFPVWGSLLLYLPAYLTVGFDVLRRAAINILHGQIFDENFLMALATLGALSLGFLPSTEPEFAEAVFVMIFYQTGELFQSIAVGKSRRSIAALMDIKPETARVLRDGGELEVAPDDVAVGETVLVRPGERIPLDGRVARGTSDVNTAALTGEALPRAVTCGDEVISGSTNGAGALFITVTKPFCDSTVSRILALMEHASTKKSKSEQFITRFARFYTPFVVLSALLLAFLPPIFAQNYLSALPLWLSRALTFLVISCPCALVISVPLSFFGGLGGASRFGVLVKGSSHLEDLARVTTIAFDKTGTLTTGDFSVKGVYPLACDEGELLRLATAAEQYSNHPLARALQATWKGDLPHPESYKEVAGRGVVCTLAGDTLAVGNQRLMQELGVDCTFANAPSGTLIFVAKNGVLLGSILFGDTVKEGAKEALLALREAGASRLCLLTGDGEEAARTVAGELGIDDYRASLLPTHKVEAVEELLSTQRGGKLAFVGDGINDAPVLSRADVGIAMGALGSDAAIEAADVVLTDDDPEKIARAIRHARRTLKIVRQNIVMALSVKLAVMLLAALGVLGALQMPLAIFADVGVAALAILNAMRTLK